MRGPLPYFTIPLFSAYLFGSFPNPSSFHLSFCFSHFERQREGRDKGERIDKEEYHLLCALFYLSSILFLALPMKIVFLLSFPPSLPSLLLTRAFDFRIEEKKRREKRNYLVLVPEASIVRLT